MPANKDDMIKAALARVLTAAEDLADSVEGHDEDDPIGSVKHLGRELADALSVLKIAEGPDEELDPEDVPEGEDDTPPECDLCEGQGFGEDHGEPVACPQCNGTGVQPEA